MEALILAAGRGTRIEHYSGGLPKALLPVGGLPIIDHQLFLLHTVGVERVTIVVGHQSERLRSAVEALTPKGMKSQFVSNPFYAVTNTLGSFWLALREIKEDLVYMNGDTIFDLPVLERVISAEADITMAVDDHPCGDEEMKVVISDGIIAQVSKQVNPLETQGEYIGVARFRQQRLSSMRHIFEKTLREEGSNAYVEAGFEAMIRAGDALTPTDITGLFWNEIDFVEDLRRAEAGFPASILAGMRG